MLADAVEPFSQTLRALPRLQDGGEGLRMSRIMGRLGARAHGTAILLLALPEALPLPVPSVGAVLGVPLMAVSGHLSLYGERGTLPRRALDWRLSPRVAAGIADWIAPIFAQAERFSRPRLAAIAGKERIAGIACLFLSVILFLPIPFVNVPVALGLVILAWGLVQRDGVIVAVGLGYAVSFATLLVAGSAALLDWVR